MASQKLSTAPFGSKFKHETEHFPCSMSAGYCIASFPIVALASPTSTATHGPWIYSYTKPLVPFLFRLSLLLPQHQPPHMGPGSTLTWNHWYHFCKPNTSVYCTSFPIVAFASPTSTATHGHLLLLSPGGCRSYMKPLVPFLCTPLLLISYTIVLFLCVIIVLYYCKDYYSFYIASVSIAYTRVSIAYSILLLRLHSECVYSLHNYGKEYHSLRHSVERKWEGELYTELHIQLYIIL